LQYPQPARFPPAAYITALGQGRISGERRAQSQSCGPIQFVCLTIRRASADAGASFAAPILVFPPRPRPRNHILDYSQVAFAAAGDALLPEIIIGLLERVADPKIPVVNSQRRTDEANQKSFLSPSYSQCLYRVPDTW